MAPVLRVEDFTRGCRLLYLFPAYYHIIQAPANGTGSFFPRVGWMCNHGLIFNMCSAVGISESEGGGLG